MKRLLIVYNPRSTRFVDVEKEVLSKTKDLKGYMVGKYEVEPTDVDKNAAKFAKLIKDGDLVISAGGDATGIIASNGILIKPAEFNCVVTIEEDICRYAQEVFQPFIDGGFEIINISKACEDVHEPNVYFISWRRAFHDVEKIVKL